MSVNKLHQYCTYNRLSEDEVSGAKHIEDVVKTKYWFHKGAFCWFYITEL